MNTILTPESETSPELRALTDMAGRYGVADLYVFGSRAREVADRVFGRPVRRSHPDSDMDFGVLPLHREPWSPQKRVDLTQELEDLFEVRRVDLVLLPEAEAFLAVDVIRGELLYTHDPDQQARYELFVLRRAGDLLPFKRERIRMILEQGAR